MFIYPIFHYRQNWSQINQIWLDWQTLNAGVIAILASAIFYQSTKYATEKQISSNLKANKAMLSHKLSDLSHYYSCSFKLLNSALTHADNQDGEMKECDIMFANALSSINENKELSIIVECMKTATANDADKLAKYVSELQIHNSRLQKIIQKRPCISEVGNSLYILSCIHRLATLQLMTNNLFSYARNQADKIEYSITSENMKTAYRNIGLLSENEELILNYTNNKINKS